MNEKEILMKILQWERLGGIQTLHRLIPELLDTNEKKKLYELTNGKNGVKEIQTKIKVSAGKLSKLWNQWYANGIVEKEGQKFKKIISLKEFGFD
ncbi:hypothetical protein HQ529_01000 [Candidatus Woesearchaeota archaeon]|nr:hypothetical protein [Candidatus Woesearchaeota archaeon]